MGLYNSKKTNNLINKNNNTQIPTNQDQDTVEEAESRLRLKEVVGAVQQDRRGVGWRENKWWSKQNEKGKREMVTEELRKMEEERRVTKAVGQSQQGAWTTWQGADNRVISWEGLKGMEPVKISMLLRSVYDLLPTPANLQKWGAADSGNCNLCGKRGTLEHVLASCDKSLNKYTWRHNEVLGVLAETVKQQCSLAHTTSERKSIKFVIKEGESTRRSELTQPLPPLVSANAAWKVEVDLGKALRFPPHITQTKLQPDMVLWSDKKKSVIIVELTVPWEGNMEWAYERKAARYTDLQIQCEENGWKCAVFPVEVGCRGFVGHSTLKFLTAIGTTPQVKKKVTRKLQQAAETASAWIWNKRG